MWERCYDDASGDIRLVGVCLRMDCSVKESAEKEKLRTRSHSYELHSVTETDRPVLCKSAQCIYLAALQVAPEDFIPAEKMPAIRS